jgi:hypothetical protein
MVTEPTLIKRVTDALAEKGVSGDCPACEHNDWRIEENSPILQISVSDEEFLPLNIHRGSFACYWLYCNNCGYVMQFLKAIVDGAVEPRVKGERNG